MATETHLESRPPLILDITRARSMLQAVATSKRLQAVHSNLVSQLGSMQDQVRTASRFTTITLMQAMSESAARGTSKLRAQSRKEVRALMGSLRTPVQAMGSMLTPELHPSPLM